jgi:hypothetical protein
MGCDYYFKGRKLTYNQFREELKGLPMSEIEEMFPSIKDEGIKTIAWTTGEQQNERYDLSKSVNRVTSRSGKDVKYVEIDAKSGSLSLEVDNNGKVLNSESEESFGQDSFVGTNLSDVIGKEVADKIMSSDKVDLSGEGLKVGGKGMKGFYDNIVPSVAKALVKELTGKEGVVGETKIEIDRQSDFSSYYQEGSAHIVEYTTSEGKKEKVFRDEESARDFMKTLDRSSFSTQQSIDITPELKASVEVGLPLFGVAKAKEELAAAKKAFDAKMRGGLQFGGLQAMPEFIRLVNAYIKDGINTVKEFIEAIKKDFPSLTLNDNILKRNYEVIKEQYDELTSVKEKLTEKSKSLSALKSRVKKATETQAATDKFRNDIIQLVKDVFPRETMLSNSVMRQLLSATTERQLTKVLDKLTALASENGQKILAAERAKIINQINALTDKRNIFYAKSKFAKIAKAKVDPKTLREVRALVDSISTPIDQMTNSQLNDYYTALSQIFEEGKVRVRERNRLQKEERKNKNFRLVEALSTKVKSFKPVTTIKDAIEKLTRKHIIRFQGRVYDSTMIDDFLRDVGVSIPFVEVDGTNYIVKKTKRGHTVMKINAAGKEVSVLKTDPNRQAAIQKFETELQNKTANEITAQAVIIPKDVDVQNKIRGLAARTQSFMGYLYDLAKSDKMLSQLKKDLYAPVMRATRRVTEDKYSLQRSHLNKRKKIFGSNGRARRILQKEAPIMIEDANGTVKKYTNAEIVYLFNVTQRPEMTQKFLSADFTQENLDQIYDYILSNTELSRQLLAYSKSLVETYGEYLPQVNDALEAAGYGIIEQKRVPTREALAKKYSQEYADKYYERMQRANGGTMPMFEPYTPASVIGYEANSMQNADLFQDKLDLKSVISNNVIETTTGGNLKIKNSEEMFASWVGGMTNMVAKLEIHADLMAVFTQSNLAMIESIYGKQYVQELKDMITSIIIGKSKSQIKQAAFNAWVNRGSAVTMFLNVPSAIGQLISVFNYGLETGAGTDYWKNFSKAIWSKEYREAFSEVASADWVLARIKGDLSSVELRELSELSSKASQHLDTLLSKGYFMTKYADATAIIVGGTPYYMTIKDKKFKELSRVMPRAEAMAKAKELAMDELYRASQQSQQSSEMPEMSAEQKNPLVRGLLTFGSVNLQYTRLMLRAARDIKNGRGNFYNNATKIAYYGFIQNFIFNLYAKGLSALIAGLGDDDDDKLIKETIGKVTNSTIDGNLRGMGVAGALAMTVKNMLYDTYIYSATKAAKRGDKLYEEEYFESSGMAQDLTDYLVSIGDSEERIKKLSPTAIVMEAFRSLHPTASMKMQQSISAISAFGKGDYLKGGAKAIQVATNAPTDRLYTIGEQINDAYNDELTILERSMRLLNIMKKYDLDKKQEKKDDEYKGF